MVQAWFLASPHDQYDITRLKNVRQFRQKPKISICCIIILSQSIVRSWHTFFLIFFLTWNKILSTWKGSLKYTSYTVDVWRLVSRINIVGNLIWVLCPLGSCFVTFFKLTRENMSKFSRDNVWNSISSNNKYARKTSVGLIFVLFVLYLNNHHENLLERNGLKIQINKETNKTNLIKRPKKYCLEKFFCIFSKTNYKIWELLIIFHESTWLLKEPQVEIHHLLSKWNWVSSVNCWLGL